MAIGLVDTLCFLSYAYTDACVSALGNVASCSIREFLWYTGVSSSCGVVWHLVALPFPLPVPHIHSD